DLARHIARRFTDDPEQLDVIWRGGELHDIGKMAIPDAILGKAGPLTDEEWGFIRNHTLIGDRILSSSPALAPVARLIRSSHEHWDGSGSPDGLAGEEIPLGSRIVHVSDAFDAITSERPYSAAMPVADAIAELRRNAGIQFDPRVVEVACEEIESG